ncbi:MAG: carbohydrate ABC transporter permease [Anaerolineae bacterium]|jgi:multiple sugar transport system permease protein
MATSTGRTLRRRHRPLRRGIRWSHLILHVLLILGSVLMLLPFLWMVSTSLKPGADVFREYPPRLIPTTVQWSNYREALTSMPFDRFYLNSFIVAISVTMLQLLTASLAAFAFARLRFRGRDILFFIYLSALMIPFPVLLVPNFIIIRNLGWFDTYAALIVPVSFSAFSTFLLRQYYRGIPMELDEAARIDGASSFRVWWQIIFPNSRPALAALAIFIFLGNWNEFLWPLIVTNSEAMRTVPVGLNSFKGQFTVRWEMLMAAAVVGMMPILVVYVLAQNWIIKGMSISGGLKG